MNGRGVWLRFWYLWAAPAALLTLNVLWLAGLRGSVLGRGSLLAQQGEATRSEVAKLESQARQLDSMAAALANLEENLDALRKQQMAPMRDRLVPFLTDVVRRTEESGLKADRVEYTVRRDKKSGLVYFSAHYEIKGTYEQVRRCVFLMETSPQFILLEGLGLRGDESPTSLEVAVQLGVGTYFSDIDEVLMRQLGVSEVAGGE